MIMNKSERQKLSYSWVSGKEVNLDSLVDFFMKNIDSNYISHGEVICGRAKNLDEWSPKAKKILKEEFKSAVSTKSSCDEYNMLAIGEINTQLIGMAFVSINNATKVAVLQDIVVDRKYRSKEIGSAFVSWIEKQIKKRQIRFLFLESGIKNNQAHSFFKENGFVKSSIVMVKHI